MPSPTGLGCWTRGVCAAALVALAACGGSEDALTSAPAQLSGVGSIDGRLEYRLANAATGRCLTTQSSDAALLDSTCGDSFGQQFRFQALGDGSFLLRNRESGQCLDAGPAASGAALVLAPCTAHQSQRWTASASAHDAVRLVESLGHRALDLLADAAGPTQAVSALSADSSATQGWKLSPAPAATPAAPRIPIKHVVVVVKENHTFDNYFGTYPGANGTLDSKGNAICPTPSGGTGPCQRAPDVPGHDLCHAHACALADWNGGAMNGWNHAGGSDTGDGLAFRQYFQQDIPNYWTYASKFTLADNFYANVLGPSLPGHLFTVAAQAGWAIDNPPTDLPFKIQWWPPHFYGPHPYWGCDEWPGDSVSILAGGTQPASVFPCFNIPSLPDVLPAGVDWKFYGTNFDGLFDEIWSPFDAVKSIRNDPNQWSKVVNVKQFTIDIKNGTLPAVTWLVDQDQYSEHPDLIIPGLGLPLGGVCAGENWTVGYLNQLVSSKYWQDTAILFTMDDFGGWHDHVPPPRQYGGSASAPYGLGMRLPLLIVSPYARPGFVFHEPAEQASIAAFIERVFGARTTLSDLDPAAQDGQANDLFGAFDFTQAPSPPPVLATHGCP